MTSIYRIKESRGSSIYPIWRSCDFDISNMAVTWSLISKTWLVLNQTSRINIKWRLIAIYRTRCCNYSLVDTPTLNHFLILIFFVLVSFRDFSELSKTWRTYPSTFLSIHRSGKVYRALSESRIPHRGNYQKDFLPRTQTLRFRRRWRPHQRAHLLLRKRKLENKKRMKLRGFFFIIIKVNRSVWELNLKI